MHGGADEVVFTIFIKIETSVYPGSHCRCRLTKEIHNPAIFQRGDGDIRHVDTGCASGKFRRTQTIAQDDIWLCVIGITEANSFCKSRNENAGCIELWGHSVVSERQFLRQAGLRAFIKVHDYRGRGACGIGNDIVGAVVGQRNICLGHTQCCSNRCLGCRKVETIKSDGCGAATCIDFKPHIGRRADIRKQQDVGIEQTWQLVMLSHQLALLPLGKNDHGQCSTICNDLHGRQHCLGKIRIRHLQRPVGITTAVAYDTGGQNRSRQAETGKRRLQLCLGGGVGNGHRVHTAMIDIERAGQPGMADIKAAINKCRNCLAHIDCIGTRPGYRGGRIGVEGLQLQGAIKITRENNLPVAAI